MCKSGLLVVEDDHFILKFLKQIAPAVHDGPCYFASSAEDALPLFEANEIGTLLTDLTLPGRSGQDLAQMLVERNPHLGVVVASGYPISAHDLSALIGADVLVLEKPFTISSLKVALEASRKLAGSMELLPA
jgi:DNA-binding NtrC family response regulator